MRVTQYRQHRHGGERSRHADQGGSAAIEFGLIILPFILIIVAIIESGLFFYRATLIESAVYDAGRFIRTGEAVDMVDAEAEYRERLCNMVVLTSCEDIVIEVLAFEDFQTASADEMDTDDEDLMESRGFDSGNANSIIILRASYEYNFLTPLVGTMFTGTAENSFPLTSMAVFRNEPFDE